MTKDETLSYRVKQLEKRIEQLDNKIDWLLQNNLPAIKEDLLSLKTRINVLTTVNIGAIIIGVIITRLLQP